MTIKHHGAGIALALAAALTLSARGSTSEPSGGDAMASSGSNDAMMSSGEDAAMRWAATR